MQHIGRVIDHLALDRVGTRTDFIAVGNWRVIGHDTGRLLARHGAQLRAQRAGGRRAGLERPPDRRGRGGVAGRGPAG